MTPTTTENLNSWLGGLGLYPSPLGVILHPLGAMWRLAQPGVELASDSTLGHTSWTSSLFGFIVDTTDTATADMAGKVGNTR